METTWHDLGIDVPFNASGNIRVSCPQCTGSRKPGNQRRKDLAVDVEQGLWHCHHCGWSGSTRQGERNKSDGGAMPHRRVDPVKVWEPPRPLPSVSIPTLWEKTVAWFATRGIPESVLVEKNITASSEFCPVCENTVGNVLFPYYVDGTHINTKHRCGRKHFRMEKGAKRVLYNLDACEMYDEVVIVEGEIDALSIHTAGIPNVVSVPDGAPAPNASSYSSKFSFLEASEQMFDRMKRVIIAVDADEPGRVLMEELARRIGPEKCSRVIWDEGIKDANECLVQAGPDYLRTCIETSVPYPVEGIFTGHDLLPDLLDLYDNGEDRGADFGNDLLDQHYRIKLGHVSIVTGIPSHGKSTVIDQLLIWLAERHDWTFAVFSPEQQPLVRHQRDLIRQHVGKSFREGDIERMTKAEVVAANTWVADRFAFVLPETTDIDTILSLARVQVFRNGVRGVVIDPWNEIEHARPRHQSETEYISDALSKIRRFARTHNVHMWVIAHPTKMRRTDDGEEPIPSLWDISGSAHFRNKADIGITVWRDLQLNNNTVEIHITKMRFDDSGSLGKVRFGYDVPSKRLYQVAQEVSR